MQEVNTNCYSIARECFALVVHYTPSEFIGSKWAVGHLKNQWYPAEGIVFSTALTNKTGQRGEGSLLRISALDGAQFLWSDGRVTLANNVRYAYRAEMLGWPRNVPNTRWTGTVGPYRMVEKAITETATAHS